MLFSAAGLGGNIGGALKAVKDLPTPKQLDDLADTIPDSLNRTDNGIQKTKCVHANCFPAGTPIATPGGLVPIERIRGGDTVWSYDLSRASWVERPVLETYQREHEGDFVTISVAGDRIESTYHHPYWVVDGRDLSSRPQPDHVPIAPSDSQLPGRWVDAGDLEAGDILILRSGQHLTIDDIHIASKTQFVYNFQVDDLHNYAVGNVAALVHNNSGHYAQRQLELESELVSLGNRKADLEASRERLYNMLRDHIERDVPGTYDLHDAILDDFDLLDTEITRLGQGIDQRLHQLSILDMLRRKGGP